MEEFTEEIQTEQHIVDLTDGRKKVIKTITQEGSGNLPLLGETVSVHYTGKLKDGTVFDSSIPRGAPFRFQLTEGKVIEGFYMAIQTMKIGEKATIEIAPEYAYGKAGDGNVIPPNSTLIFELELISSEHTKKDKQQMNIEERLNAASQEKELGNDKFKQGQILSASQAYKLALDYLDGVEEWPENLLKTMQTLAVACYLNLSNCEFKAEEYLHAIQHATKALEIDPNNVKGLYRRGLAEMKFGSLKKAKIDLVKAVQLEPKSQNIKKDLNKCKELLQAQNQAEKMKYKNWMGKLDLYSDKSPQELDVTQLDKVFFDLTIDNTEVKKITFALYNDTPKTTKNFKALCTGEYGVGVSGKPLHYLNSKFHRLIKGFMLQGGDFTNGNGTGGESIYGEKFEDENFKHKHTKRGQLSMANAGPNTNGSQFFITFVACPHLDGRHVVFGEIVEGLDVLDQIEEIPTGPSDVPMKSIEITNCGLVEAN